MFMSSRQLVDIGGREIAKSLMEKRAAYDKSSQKVFISHSSVDSHLIPGVEKFFGQFGVGVYADVMDERLQGLPDWGKAVLLKAEIAKCDKLVILATAATKTSKWVPWELGIGDGAYGHIHAGLFPVTPEGAEEEWAKQGYMDLYPRIHHLELEGGNGPEWVVRDPSTGKYWRMAQWLGLQTRK